MYIEVRLGTVDCYQTKDKAMVERRAKPREPERRGTGILVPPA